MAGSLLHPLLHLCSAHTVGVPQAYAIMDRLFVLGLGAPGDSCCPFQVHLRIERQSDCVTVAVEESGLENPPSAGRTGFKRTPLANLFLRREKVTCKQTNKQTNKQTVSPL
jgi:hypothetical protein